jgi:hypothetical protein
MVMFVEMEIHEIVHRLVLIRDNLKDCNPATNNRFSRRSEIMIKLSPFQFNVSIMNREDKNVIKAKKLIDDIKTMIVHRPRPKPEPEPEPKPKPELELSLFTVDNLRRFVYVKDDVISTLWKKQLTISRN